MARNLNRKGLAIIFIILVLSTGIYFILVPIGSSFHYDKIEEPDNSEFQVRISNIYDCAITVSFTNTPALVYSLDIEMYEFTSSSTFSFVETDIMVSINYYSRVIGGLKSYTGEDVRIKAINLTLGTGKHYDIRISGTNLITTVSYTNGALFDDGDAFEYTADDSTIALTYDGYAVDATSLSGPQELANIHIKLGGDLISAFINISLPVYHYGEVQTNLDASNSVSVTGWDSYEYGLYRKYRTGSYNLYIPRLWVEVSSLMVSGFLSSPH